MTDRHSKKAARKQHLKSRMLDALQGAEATTVLGILISRHPKLKVEAEEIAKELVSSPSAKQVAEDVISAITLIDEDEMAARAGKHSWGYVEPSEAAMQLLEEAMEDVLADMKRRMELGLEDAARIICCGIAMGLHEIEETCKDGLLGWAPEFPAEEACFAVAELIRACPMSNRRHVGKLLIEALAPDLPDWSAMLARTVKEAVSRR